VIGFKEIRYQTPEVLQFLGTVFPCARFIFTYRENSRAPVRSAVFRHSPNHPDMQGEWAQGAALFKTVHARFPNTTALLPVEELTTEKYNQVLHELLAVRGCSFKDVAHANSGGDFSKVDDTVLDGPDAASSPLEGECDLRRVDFSISDAAVFRQHAQAWWDIRSEYDPAQGGQPFIRHPNAPEAPVLPPRFASLFFSPDNHRHGHSSKWSI
jgi:hypothetical protein